MVQAPASQNGTIAVIDDLRRAGFWRRFFSMFVDGVLTAIPVQILAAVLFAATAGHVHMANIGTTCRVLQTLPEPRPQIPLQRVDEVQRCDTSFFGARSGSWNIASRIERQGNYTYAESWAWALDAEGKPADVYSIDGLANVALVVYLVALVTRYGRTLGDRVTGIRVIAVATPDGIGMPLRTSILRCALLSLLYLPMFVGGGAISGREAFAMHDLFGVLVGGAVSLILAVVALVPIVRRRDPFYDRWAGTAVVRVAR